MPSANKLFNYLFYLWHKHDDTLFFGRIVHLPIVDLTTELLRRTTPDLVVPDVATEVTRPNSGEEWKL